MKTMKWNSAGHPGRRIAGFLASIGISGGLMLGGWAADCPPVDEGLSNHAHVGDGYQYLCDIQEQWATSEDLDGDGRVDFWHRRLDAYQSWWYEELGSAVGAYQTDKIEGLYPEPHVDVRGEYNPWYYPRQPAHFAVEPGIWIEPTYPPYDCVWPDFHCAGWNSEVTWLQPYLESMGLGFAWRSIDYYPCLELGCSSGFAAGVISPSEGEKSAEAFVAFRLREPDGWHLGWMRLDWSLEPVQPPIGHTTLADYAIHPEPERPIAAGEPPRPTLHARVEGDEIVLSWHAVWTGFVLERSPSAAGAAWESVPGVENNTIRLPKTGLPSFFRLKRQRAP